jgi:hypothetical protein
VVTLGCDATFKWATSDDLITWSDPVEFDLRKGLAPNGASCLPVCLCLSGWLAACVPACRRACLLGCASVSLTSLSDFSVLVLAGACVSAVSKMVVGMNYPTFMDPTAPKAFNDRNYYTVGQHPYLFWCGGKTSVLRRFILNIAKIGSGQIYRTRAEKQGVFSVCRASLGHSPYSDGRHQWATPFTFEK